MTELTPPSSSERDEDLTDPGEDNETTYTKPVAAMITQSQNSQHIKKKVKFSNMTSNPFRPVNNHGIIRVYRPSSAQQHANIDCQSEDNTSQISSETQLLTPVIVPATPLTDVYHSGPNRALVTPDGFYQEKQATLKCTVCNGYNSKSRGAEWSFRCSTCKIYNICTPCYEKQNGMILHNHHKSPSFMNRMRSLKARTSFPASHSSHTEQSQAQLTVSGYERTPIPFLQHTNAYK
jgi:hypothetical protein